MNLLKSFTSKLSRIGIKVEFVSNYPWIYLDKINGKKVQGTYLGNHGFTAFYLTIQRDNPNEYIMNDTKIIFNKIRETLK